MWVRIFHICLAIFLLGLGTGVIKNQKLADVVFIFLGTGALVYHSYRLHGMLCS